MALKRPPSPFEQFRMSWMMSWQTMTMASSTCLASSDEEELDRQRPWWRELWRRSSWSRESLAAPPSLNTKQGLGHSLWKTMRALLCQVWTGDTSSVVILIHDNKCMVPCCVLWMGLQIDCTDICWLLRCLTRQMSPLIGRSWCWSGLPGPCTLDWVREQHPSYSILLWAKS